MRSHVNYSSFILGCYYGLNFNARGYGMKDTNSVILKLSVLVVLACTVKFLLEGVVLHYGTTSIDLGHADSLAYAALLSPVLGTHGYLQGKKSFGLDEKTDK